MEINEIIDLTRSQLRQGETGKALETLHRALENNPQYAEVLRTLRVVEANYNATRQQEIKGILSFQEAQRQYSQVNDALFSAIDDLAAGRTSARTPAAPASSPPSSSRLVWIAGGAVVLIVGVIAGTWFSRKGTPKSGAGATKEEINCPAFTGLGQRVIILPFQNIGAVAARPDLIIQSRIRELSGKNNFSSSVEVLTTYDSVKNNPDIAEASGIGRLCGADLVIWGQYDKSDSIKVDIRYVFTKSGILGRSPGFLAFKDLPALRDGRMVRGLDDAIFACAA
ncbi:MAG: hypothetical protein IPJ82_10295 [Lewinellaceae bacterium]|nr:hypothetical protein [Lewinellaceae bacterium]